MNDADDDRRPDPSNADSALRRSVPVPAGEALRLAELYAADILDGEREEAYDAIVRTATFIADAPVALVSLVDADRQWLKACVGLGLNGTGRDEAFCAHAILHPGTPLIVPDATRDPRFRDNPFVVGPPHIRFYCGVPLVTDSGQAYGTLCVIDFEPRQLEPRQLAALKDLASQTSALIQSRARVLELEQGDERDTRKHVAMLRAIGEVTATATDLDTLLEGVLSAIVRELQLGAGGLWWRDGEELATQALWVDATDGRLAGVEHARQGLHYSSDTIIHSLDSVTRHGTDVLPTIVSAALQAVGTEAAFAVPIVVDGVVVGAFELLSSTAADPSPRQLLAAAQAAAEAGRWIERDRASQWIHNASSHDPTTGLLNRRGIPPTLEAALADVETGSTGGVGLLLIGLNNFAELSTSLSREELDVLMIGVVAAIRFAVPPEVRLGRHDESTVLVIVDAVAQSGDLGDLAEAVHAALATPIASDGLVVPVSASIGIAFAPYGGDGHGVLTSAEDALTEARRVGSRTLTTTVASPAEARRRLTLKVRLAQAPASGDLTVVYQPLVQLATDRIVAVEALARWHDAEFGDVPPDEFIALAEESSTITGIGAHIRRQALHDLPLLQVGAAEQDALALWVNVSARELTPDYARTVLAELEAARIAPERLTLEVTERLALAAGDPATAQLFELAAAGVAIAVDDFGTGFTSLTQLRNLPLTRIKVDRSFTADLVGTHRERMQSIVRGIVQLGHSIGLEVVIEGIETSEQLAIVRDLGVDLAQGYLLANPEPLTVA